MPVIKGKLALLLSPNQVIVSDRYKKQNRYLLHFCTPEDRLEHQSLPGFDPCSYS